MEINPGTTDEPSNLEIFDRIEDQLKCGGEGDNRVDNFKPMFELQFDLPISNIEDIEDKLVDDSDIQIYDYSKARFIELFDNYFGIVADDSFHQVDLELLYNLYAAFHLKFIYYITKYCYGSLLKSYQTNEAIRKFVEEMHKSPSYETEAEGLIYPFIEDEAVFEAEDMLDAIIMTDPGNDFIINLKDLVSRGIVNVDNIAIRRRISMEVLQGENENGILNLLRTYINADKGEIA